MTLDLLDQALQRPDGNPTGINQHTRGTVDIVNGSSKEVERPDGTSKARALRHLREKRPDLLERIVKDNVEASLALRNMLKQPHGGDHTSEQAKEQSKTDNISLAHDIETIDLLDQALQRPHGGDRRSEEAREEINVDNVNVDNEVERPDGNSKMRALRHLREKRPDLLERVKAGELSPHAAMREVA